MKVKRMLKRFGSTVLLVATCGLLWLGGMLLPGAPPASATVEAAQLDIVFVLDNSGSMIANDPDFIIREVVTDFLQNAGPGVRLGMVIFDTQAILAESLVDIEVPETRARLLASLDQINYQGQYTNTPAAIERAIYELKTNGNPDARQVIILLTDGIVDTGNKSEDLESERWLKEQLTLESKKLGIRIFGVAFTDKADFRLIQTLAVNTDGEYFRAYRAEDIQGVFEKINRIVMQPPVIEPQAAVKPDVKPLPAPVPQPVAPAPPPASAEPSRKLMLVPLILSAVVVILGMAVILVLIFNRKGRDKAAEEAARAETARKAKAEAQMIEAELIDAENIVASDSKSLILNKRHVSVGRDSSNDIVIPMEAVSSLHATIEYKNGNFYLEDNRSTNGTLLNDKKMEESTPVRLKSGDKITFAVYEFRFLLPDLAPFGETVMIREADREKLKAEIAAQKAAGVPQEE
jgi:Mg-chelatase subunit ChlD